LGLSIQSTNLTNGAGKLRFGGGNRDVCICRVQLDQNLATLHGLRVVGVNAEHRARHFARDLHDVAGDVGVVSALVVARYRKPVSRVADGTERDDGSKNQQAPSASAVAVRGGSVSGVGITHGSSVA